MIIRYHSHVRHFVVPYRPVHDPPHTQPPFRHDRAPLPGRDHRSHPHSGSGLALRTRGRGDANTRRGASYGSRPNGHSADGGRPRRFTTARFGMPVLPAPDPADDARGHPDPGLTAAGALFADRPRRGRSRSTAPRTPHEPWASCALSPAQPRTTRLSRDALATSSLKLARAPCTENTHSELTTELDCPRVSPRSKQGVADLR